MSLLRLLTLSFTALSTVQAEPRVFVSLAGSLLEAEITAISGDNVTLKRVSDGQPLTVSLRTLCKEDNAYVSRWAEQNQDKAASTAPEAAVAAAPAQKFSLSCQAQPSKASRGAQGGVERTIELSYNFNLSNREVKRDLENARGIAFVLGKGSEIGNDLIVIQKKTFDVNIRAQSKTTYSTKPVLLTYSQGTGAGSSYGVKSAGYVLIIQDSAGNTLFTEASPDTYARYVKELIAIKEVPCVVDRDFKLKEGAAVPMGIGF